MKSQIPIYCTKEKSCYCPKCQQIPMTKEEMKDTQEEKEFQQKERLPVRIRIMIDEARADERKKMVAILDNNKTLEMLLDEHICAFNDDDQTCTCVLRVFADLKHLLTNQDN